MALWTKHLASVVVMVALATTPTLIAVCLAVCMPSLSAIEVRSAGDATPGAPASSPAVTHSGHSGHEHHQALTSAQPGSIIPNGQAGISPGHLAGPGHDCCPDDSSVSGPSTAERRADRQMLCALIDMSRNGSLSVLLTPRQSHLPLSASPPSPIRVPSVLRI